MICETLGINTCFNCTHITKNSTEEIRELSCWVNVYKRGIDMMVLSGISVNEAIGKELIIVKDHPVGEPDFPEFYWLKVCVERYYPEYTDTLEKLLLLT